MLFPLILLFSNVNAPASALCFELIMMFELLIRLSDLKPQVYSIPSIHIQQKYPQTIMTPRDLKRDIPTVQLHSDLCRWPALDHMRNLHVAPQQPKSAFHWQQAAAPNSPASRRSWRSNDEPCPIQGASGSLVLLSCPISKVLQHGKIRAIFGWQQQDTVFFRFQVEGNAKKWVMICHDVSFAPWLWTHISMIPCFGYSDCGEQWLSTF